MLDTDGVTFSANQPGDGGSSGHGTSTGGKSGSGSGSQGAGATGGAATGTAGVGPSGGNSSSGSSTGGTGQGGTSGGSSTGGAGGAAQAGSGGSSTGGAAQAGSSGSSTGGSAQAGSSGSSTGGSAQAGSSGSSTGGAAQGGGTALDPYARSVCNDYCKATSQIPCPGTSFPFLQCTSACINEVIHSPQCEKPAEILLSCLTTVYQNSKTCSQADDLSAAKCSALSAAYQDCVSANPDPVPPPVPPPASACSSYGSSSSSGNCDLGVKCDNGAYYKVSCAQSSSVASSCTCFSSSADGTSTGSSFNLNEGVAFACYDSLAVCGFPQFAAP